MTEHSQAEKIILLLASQDLQKKKKKKQFEINRAFTNKRNTFISQLRFVTLCI